MNRSPLIGLICNVEPETELGHYITAARIVEVLPSGNLMLVTSEGRLTVHRPHCVTITQRGLLQDRLDFGRRPDQMI